ncbi:ComF family protein [Candidatus Desantisbacteria bacterium CG_4_10_14_0_8_um_filter_48_22]|uniref:ComF family protein n=1 Tax=Candidatus Desantisbacteria bacterium CG_4_10_14_0_8_um_filter_48_22 TaxID=1974543 RepID=A0A2M7SES9_9BACT|nr:MAG: ComF family protein [Candidatus Desantisbacteria bacterium CG02_land_8_20_14_3_00_49_13]PIZ17989.1 MAG: ComF family protein [Candidatus Desantisbacteria bacterium CG_4_10_14_0_8_um_filter_48_22]
MDSGQNSLRYFAEGLLNFIYPPRCLACSKLLEDNAGLCGQCFEEIRIIVDPYCQRCGMPLDPPEAFKGIETPLCADCRNHRRPFALARSIGRYEGVLKKCIHLFKYKGRKVILKPIDKLISLYFPGLFPVEKISFIVPVPLHRKRLREREFNQSELVADMIGSKYGIPVLADILSRTVYTSPQVALTRDERAENVKGAFKAGESSWLPKSNILLVDDVYTTGATACECARVLKQAGAESVYIFTLAHDV